MQYGELQQTRPQLFTYNSIIIVLRQGLPHVPLNITILYCMRITMTQKKGNVWYSDTKVMY